MNYKLEKFWNSKYSYEFIHTNLMNYKLEKFWNLSDVLYLTIGVDEL